MSDNGPLYVGRSLLRREDRRLLRGQERRADAIRRLICRDTGPNHMCLSRLSDKRDSDGGKNGGLHPPYPCSLDVERGRRVALPVSVTLPQRRGHLNRERLASLPSVLPAIPRCAMPR
jgi:hypothetical protein